ncbi:lyase family protein [Glutamicibacter sp.]|uniref:lyase family protein n=1 Tax=Glutamicibacter sp. TaxID=1931995 RepID=UPI0028BF5914|nr:lyase family protein [Glutamicibacter sp.]
MSGVDYGVLTPVWAGGAAPERSGDEAFVAAMLRVELAWVQVQSQAGLCSQADLDAVQAVADVARYDLAQLAAKTPDGANALIPLLGMMRALLAADGAPAGAGTALHRGATSQDIIDTALMLLLHDGVQAVLQSLHRTASGLADLAAAHRDTVCIARSLTQHALPTTFGYKAACWLSAVLGAAKNLEQLRGHLPLQFGGAVGTLASLEQHLAGRTEITATTGQLSQRLADRLDLASPATPWHSNRLPIMQAGSALGAAIAALGTFGADVLTASRPEIGEITEPREAGKGGSSAMPQKQNPVHSLLLRSAALNAPGHVATLYTAAGTAVDERPDGAWHAEWPALRELLRLAIGSSEHAAILATGMSINTDALTRNLKLGGDAVLSERLATVLGPVVAGGKPAIQRLVLQSLTEGGSLRELLRASTDQQLLSDELLDELLDPAGYLGAAGRFTDNVLAEYSAWKETWQSQR